MEAVETKPDLTTSAPVANTGASPDAGSATDAAKSDHNHGAATQLKSATTVVAIGAATAPTAGQVLTATSGTAATWQTPSGGGANLSIAVIQDQKSSGTAGQNLTQNTWNTRNLNTEAFDPDGIVSISSNQFTLSAGEYDISWVCNARQGPTSHKTRLYNVTDAVAVGQGMNFFLNAGEVPLTGTAYVNITSGSKVFQLEHYTDGSGVSGGGAMGSGAPEIYAQVVIRKVG
jgi:hypothetical protein